VNLLPPAILAAAVLCLAGSLHAQAPGRIAYTCDGQFHDRDDWGSLPMSQAIAVRAGRHVDHWNINSHRPETIRSWELQMRTSAEGYGLPYWDCRAFWNGTADDLRAQIMRSTAGNPLWIGLAGPPDIIFTALQGVPASIRQHVTVCSHSSRYNEVTGGQKKLSDCWGVQKIFIPNGNARLNTKQNAGPWKWLRYSEPFVWNRMQKSGRWDASDATLMGYMVHGERQTSIDDLKFWLMP
jgi:hypothetical protein